MTLPYPPPFMCLSTLAEHICLSERAIEQWVSDGRLPPPKTRRGKRLWRWTEVVQYLDNDSGIVPNDVATNITEATRHAAKAR